MFQMILQTPVTQYEGDGRIVMKILGELVDILCKISLEIYKPYVRFDKKIGEKILYVRMLKTLYGILIASLLYYKEF